jgi:hypothetical protein
MTAERRPTAAGRGTVQLDLMPSDAEPIQLEPMPPWGDRAAYLYTAQVQTNANATAGLLRVLFPDARTILDMTYGKGNFWNGKADVEVVGIDLDPGRARDVCADFTRLPFADGAFDVAIFDPPYQWDMGRGKASIIGALFGTYGSEADAKRAVQLGSLEAWRVSRLGVLVKVQNYIHASRLVHMTRWVEDAIPSPLYDELHLVNPRKLIVPRWKDQLSVYRNHSTFLAFRHGDQRHVRRAAHAPARRPAAGIGRTA